MRRAKFMQLTGLTEGEIRMRASRDQLPFVAGGAGQRNYTPFDAFLVRVTDTLADWGFGLGWAAWMVRDCAGTFRKDWQKITEAGGAYFLAIVRVPAKDGGEVDLKFFGEFEIVAVNLDRHASRATRPICIFPISSAWRFVLERAAGSLEEDSVDISDVFGGGA